MNVKEAIKERHSVRQYKDIPIEESDAEKLRSVISECCEESGLDIQLILNEPECFDTMIARYGKFSGVKNYIAISGDRAMIKLDELAGYYGQRIVIEAQMMGLNTCWVGGTYSKSKCRAELSKGEKLICVIALGYGENEGTKHRSKPLEKLCGVSKEDMPAWFKTGMTAALMAPTALGQQKFYITLDGEDAFITAKKGMMTELDMGIVRYNFEAASGHPCWSE